MENKSFLSLVVLLSMLISCQPITPILPIPVVSSPSPVFLKTPTEEKLPIPIIVIPPTSQPIHPVGEIFDPTYVPISRNLHNIVSQSCLKFDAEDAKNKPIGANLVLHDRIKNTNYIQTPLNKMIDLSDSYFGPVSVSPNRQLVAFLQYGSTSKIATKLIIQSVDGKIHKEIATSSIGGFLSLTGWLSDKDLILMLGKYGINQPFTTIAFDPFTNEQKKLSEDLPNIYNLANWFWLGWGNAKYSPDFRYVIYPSSITKSGDPGSPRYVLWDIENQKEITAAITDITGNLAEIPQWDLTGKIFAVRINHNNNDVLLSANIDGTVTKLTDTWDLYPNVNTHIHGWSWSPDSRFIAFWLDIHQKYSTSMLERNPVREERLMVINVETGAITDYCDIGDTIQVEFSSLPYTPAPIWSPDGKSLLVEQRLALRESQLVQIDLGANTASVIGKNLYPIGWMVDTR